MRKVIVHGGLPKTGTSSIQYCLANNQSALRKSGILYPISGRPKVRPRFGHHLLVWSFTGRRRASKHRGWLRLLKEIEESSAETVVLSAEGFSRLKSPDVREVGHHLREFDVQIVFYLRDQIEFLKSLFKQRIKADGYAGDFAEFASRNLWRADYQGLLNRWGDVFGQDAIQMRIYDKIKRPSGVVGDFLNLLGPHASEIQTSGACERPVNVSNPDFVVSMMLRLNRRAAAMSKWNPQRYLLSVARYSVRLKALQNVAMRFSRESALAELFAHETITQLQIDLAEQNREFLENYVQSEDWHFFMAAD
jgi:hypothetical protein